MNDNQEIKNKISKLVDDCFNEMIESGDWLDNMIIDENGRHLDVGTSKMSTKLNEAMDKVFDLIGYDSPLVNFALNLAGKYGDDSEIKRKREEAFGWEQGKVVASADLSQEQIDDYLEMIKNYHCPHCEDKDNDNGN